MELRDYLHVNRMTGVNFAKKINYHPIYVRECSNGRFFPGTKFIKIVEKATDGLVKLEDWKNGLVKLEELKKDVDENELSA